MIESFDWDEHNISHIARHHVCTSEVEELFEGRYYLIRSRDGRYAVFGQSAAGRYLFCALERTLQAGRIRIVTARDMESWERRLFKRKT